MASLSRLQHSPSYLADSLATAAPADVSEEAAASRNKDSNEDDFPDVSPDSLAAFPPTDKYAVVGEYRC